ncbi:transcription termination/antitermination NusG family protein [Bosea eneae]|uniref:Transcription termination/antitermination NusG family protein n=1 Tax=Bosea eneae TaxID=151454 RepID=A0ABW0J1G2_9HYPH
MNENLAWYVIDTKSNQERLCAQVMASRGFHSYLPMKTVRIRHPV